jgi:hypothetical protein
MSMSFLQTLPLAQSYFFAIPPGTPVVSDDGFLLHSSLGVSSRSQGSVRDLFRVIKSVSGPPVRTLADAIVLLLRLGSGQTFSVWLTSISHVDGAPLLHSYSMARAISPCRLLSYNVAEALCQQDCTFQGWRSTNLPVEPHGYDEWGHALWRAIVGQSVVEASGGELQLPVIKDADEPVVQKGTVAVSKLRHDVSKHAIQASLLVANRLATDPGAAGVMLAAEGADWVCRHAWQLAAAATGIQRPPPGAPNNAGAKSGGDDGDALLDSSEIHQLGGAPLRRLDAQQLAQRREVLLHLRRRSRASTSAPNMSRGRCAAALSIIEVSCRPFTGLNGLRSYRTSHRTPGVGVIVDHALGLVLLSGSDAPTLFCDVLVGLGDTTIPGRVVTIHPEHGWALVQADIAAQPWADLVRETVICPLGVPDPNTFSRHASPEAKARYEWLGRTHTIAQTISYVIAPVPILRRWITDVLESAAVMTRRALNLEPFTSRRRTNSSNIVIGTSSSGAELSELQPLHGLRRTFLMGVARSAYTSTGFKANRIIGVEGYLGGIEFAKLQSGMVFSSQGKLRGLLLPDVSKGFVLPSDYFCEPIRQIRLRMRGSPLLPGQSPASQVPDLDLRSLGATFASMPVRDAMALYRLPADVRRRVLDAASQQTSCVIVQAASRDTWSAPPIPPGCSGGMLPGEEWSRLKDGDMLLDYLPFPAGFDDVEPGAPRPVNLPASVLAADRAEEALRSAAEERREAAARAKARSADPGTDEAVAHAIQAEHAAKRQLDLLLQQLQPIAMDWHPPSWGGSLAPGITYRATWKRHTRISAVPFAAPVMAALARALTASTQDAAATARATAATGAAAAAQSIVPLSAGASLRIAGLDPRFAHPKPVISVRELTLRAMRAPFVRFRLIRNGSVRLVRVPTWRQDFRESSAKDVLLWAGIVLHNADTALRREATPPTITSACGRSRVPCKLITAITEPGSPGQRSLGSQPRFWVLSIDGRPTPDVAEAARIVATLQDRKAERVETASFLNGHRQALSVRLCEFTNPTERYLHAHPTFAWTKIPVRVSPARGGGPTDQEASSGAATSAAGLGGPDDALEPHGLAKTLSAASASHIQGDPAAVTSEELSPEAGFAAPDDADDAPAPQLMRVSSLTVGASFAARDAKHLESLPRAAPKPGSVRRVFLVPDSGSGSYKCVAATAPTAREAEAAGMAFSMPLVTAPIQPKSAKTSEFLFNKAFDDMGLDQLETGAAEHADDTPASASAFGAVTPTKDSDPLQEYGSASSIGATSFSETEPAAPSEALPLSRARAKAIELAFEQAQSVMSTNQQVVVVWWACGIVGSVATVAIAIPVWNGLRRTSAAKAVGGRLKSTAQYWIEQGKTWMQKI